MLAAKVLATLAHLSTSTSTGTGTGMGMGTQANSKMPTQVVLMGAVRTNTNTSQR